MAGSLREARLTTRNSRAALPAGTHWRAIDPDVHLGYRKNGRGGRWLVRWYLGDRRYRQETLGTADDVLSEGTLSFDDAVRAAREKVTDARKVREVAASVPAPTVRSAVEAYITMRNERLSASVGRPRRSDAASRLTRHVLGDRIAKSELASISEHHLEEWKRRLNPALKPGSRIRTINDFKAALNLAFKRNRSRLPRELGEIVRLGLSRDEGLRVPANGARDNQILSDEVVRKIIATAREADEEGDLYRMILVLAATGARFSQVQRLQVRDVQAAQRRIMMPSSRKGRGKVEAAYPVQVGKDVIDALLPVIDGRGVSEPLLCRWRHVQTGVTEWRRDRRGAWTAASELTRPWRQICQQLSLDVVPYALRHSSIVRAIRAGLPIRLVAALHDTSVAMIERHYSRWIVDGLEELAARAVVPLTGGSGAGIDQPTSKV